MTLLPCTTVIGMHFLACASTRQHLNAHIQISGAGTYIWVNTQQIDSSSLQLQTTWSRKLLSNKEHCKQVLYPLVRVPLCHMLEEKADYDTPALPSPCAIHYCKEFLCTQNQVKTGVKIESYYQAGRCQSLRVSFPRASKTAYLFASSIKSRLSRSDKACSCGKDAALFSASHRLSGLSPASGETLPCNVISLIGEGIWVAPKRWKPSPWQLAITLKSLLKAIIPF